MSYQPKNAVSQWDVAASCFTSIIMSVLVSLFLVQLVAPTKERVKSLEQHLQLEWVNIGAKDDPKFVHRPIEGVKRAAN